MSLSRGPRPIHMFCARCAQSQANKRLYTATAAARSASEHLPRVARTSFWAGLVPKSLRERSWSRTPGQSREWNPATPFIFLGIIVGSNAVNLLALRNEMMNFSRKTDAKLSLLREVIQKVKDGEDVDAKRALGTGDPKEEAEWEEVMRELETTDMLWEGRKKREVQRAETRERVKRREMEEAARREGMSRTRSPQSQEPESQQRPKFLM